TCWKDRRRPSCCGRARNSSRPPPTRASWRAPHRTCCSASPLTMASGPWPGRSWKPNCAPLSTCGCAPACGCVPRSARSTAAACPSTPIWPSNSSATPAGRAEPVQNTHVKTHAGAPAGFFPTEAAGLNWLAEAGGAQVVQVIDVDEHHLVLQRLDADRPDAEAARRFGRGLATTHSAGAPAFGSLPPGAPGYWFGPLSDPIELPTEESNSFGAFYAEDRLRPLVRMCTETGAIGGQLAEDVERLCTRLNEGEWDTYPDGSAVQPARIHGDLWSGNLMWTTSGAVLIEPAACGGHPEADLAMLALFGAPHLEEIFSAYGEATTLPEGWRERIGLHQVFPLLVHALLFGGGYAAA